MREYLRIIVGLLGMACGCPSVSFAQYDQLPVNRPGFVWMEVSSESIATTQTYSSQTYTQSQSFVSTTQQAAIAEANRLASGGTGYYRRTGGHPGGNMPGARFTGTGYSSSPNNVPTCEPRTRMTLIADVVRRGVDGMYYRVRAWK
jgi:hypothetical protein